MGKLYTNSSLHLISNISLASSYLLSEVVCLVLLCVCTEAVADKQETTIEASGGRVGEDQVSTEEGKNRFPPTASHHYSTER